MSGEQQLLMMMANTYMAALHLNIGLKEPVFSNKKPTAKVPMMPAAEPKVFARPNSCPARRGAVSDMLATNAA